MRYIVFLMLLLSTCSLFGQKTWTEKEVNVSYSDKLLDLVFLDLELKYGLEFEYEEADVKDIRISRSFRKMPLNEAMKALLFGKNLYFDFQEPKRVLISKTPFAAPIQLAPTRDNFTIKGKIKDKKTGETLPFASIQIQGTTNGVRTNVDGFFTLFNVPSDTTVLLLRYLGYHTKALRLSPDMDMENLSIELVDMSTELYEVVISADKEEQLLKASTGISRLAISPAAMATLPSFGEKDVFRSLQLLPGVSGSNEASSGLYVRGGTPDQNLVLFDGFTVYHVDHLFGFFSAFNPNAIKDVQLHKGGFESKFGGRLSSVVELTGKDGNTEQFNMGVGLSLLAVNGFVEAPFAKGKGSVLVAARRSFQSGFYTKIFDSFTDANQSNADVQAPRGGRFGQQEVTPNTYFYDLNAKISYRPSSKDLIALSFFNGQDDLDNSRKTDNSAFRGGQNLNFNFNRESTDLTTWGNWGSSAKWSRQWSDGYYSNANFSFSNYYSTRDRRNATTITRSDTTFTNQNGSYEANDLKDFTFKFDNEVKIGKQNQLEFGIQSSYNDIDYIYTQNDTISVLDRKNQGWTNSVYVQDRFTFSDKLILTGGLRTSLYSVTEQLYLEPRASAMYMLNKNLKAKAAWGKYNQFATRVVREDIQQGSRDFWILADDESAPIGSSTHYIGGFAYEMPVYLFDVEAYHKNLNGLTEYSTRFVPTGFGPNRSLNYEEYFYTGNGFAQGIEFLAQKKTGRTTGWVSYTLGRVRYDFDAFGDESFAANQDQTHELKIIANHKIGSQLTLGATFIYATGRPYTAPTGFYEVELLNGTSADFFDVSDKNALRLPNYHRFDISATYDFYLGNSKANLGLSLFNVYNRNNVWYKEYEVIEGELLETDITLLNLTPSLFFNYKFR